MEHLGGAILGWLIGASAVVIAWTSLSHQSLLQRLIFLGCGFAAAAAAWSLGLMAQFDTERVVLSQRDEIAILGMFPTLMLAVALPMIVVRKIFGCVLAPIEEARPNRSTITTAWLMLVTAIVAICAAGLQFFATQLGQSLKDIAVDLGIVTSIFLGVSLVIVLPSTLLLFSRRRNFTIWSLVLIVVNSLIPLVLLRVIPRLFSGPRMSFKDYTITIMGFGFAMIAFVVGAACVRSLGFRLGKEIKQQ